MEQIRAGEQLDEAATASVPWMDEEGRSETLREMQRIAGGTASVSDVVEEKRWGGGYGSDVESISMESLREDLRRDASG